MSSGPLISLEDYDAIASAVMETERGRWFLAEYARRNRAADTAAVLEALAAVEARLAERSGAPSPDLSADAQVLTRYIRAAAASAARVRLTLESSVKAGRIVTRSLAGVQEVERELSDALAALQAVQRDEADVAPPPDAAAGTPVHAQAPALSATVTAEPDAPAEAIAPERPPAPAAAPVSLPEAATVIPFRPIEDASHPFVDEAAVLDELAAALAEELERSRSASPLPNAAPRAPSVPALPKAWTPGLLDQLSEAEKAILFA